MYTIGTLIKRFRLSRSTLLYYDKIGLLRPSARTAANYRVYTDQDVVRMGQIELYKQAGLPLESIRDLLDEPNNQLSDLLEKRLETLNGEIGRMRQQQQLILQQLGKDSLLRTAKVMNKEQWIAILHASGMDEEDMHQWHVAFERQMPLAHTDFLEALGMSANEISAIKQLAQTAAE